MSEYLRFCTFRRRQPDVISPIFEKLMQGFSEVKGGVKSKVITVLYLVDLSKKTPFYVDKTILL
jgi:hypothetical protein